MIPLVRTEFVKAAVRLRTLIVAALLVGLPILIVVAIHARRNRPVRGNGEGLFRLAQQSGLLVPAAVLSAMSGFLLVVIAGVLAGDSIAGDATWGNLRYVLMRPVARSRLLVAKGLVAGVLIWSATILVSIAALITGVALFGSHAAVVPRILAGSLVAGPRLTTSTLLARAALATAYVAFGYSALLALGVLFSTMTDNAAGAIGATVGVYIVSEILDGISQLGQIRYAFPTHYLDAWKSMFLADTFSHDMIAGAIVQVIYLVIVGAAAIIWFRHKDIRS